MSCGGSGSGGGGGRGAVRRRPPPPAPPPPRSLASELSELALDQGYHTLAETGGGGVRRRRELAAPAHPPAHALSDALWSRILEQLDVAELCRAARVCRRWARLVGRLAARPETWAAVRLDGGALEAAVRAVAARAGPAGRDAATDWRARGCSITPAATHLLARTFRSLTRVQLTSAAALDARGLAPILLELPGLRHLDLTGCPRVNWPEWARLESALGSRRVPLECLDLTDCTAVSDGGLLSALQTCPDLLYLYLRRCTLVTDASIKALPSYCAGLKELSVSDCVGVTDFGLYQLARLGPALRYLSVAKCTQVSDAGVGAIARRCYRLRYVNARGCCAVGDEGAAALARGCSRLRALDLGATDVSEPGLQVLARCCPNLKKLALRGCELLGDDGLEAVAYYCRGLRQLNIQDTPVTIRGYRAVKKYCKRCVIEHTNPGFC